MPKTYVRIQDGKVAETFVNNTEFPMSELFHPDLVWVDVTGMDPIPAAGSTYDGNEFGPPVLFTEEELRIRFEQAKGLLMDQANMQISLLQDSVDLGDSSDETATSLKAWRQYRLDLSTLEFADGVEFPAPPNA
ncbi:tail fiber assembly protein [Bordetella genomosp. 9]|uniref:tail fiber assembly protein n=1 Tax=Bordetella genomosp. 9 TaxID=1416803 RepID=UPI0012F92897|nr:tail fiber assembly protein [Bordetella genomosp. 9]